MRRVSLILILIVSFFSLKLFSKNITYYDNYTDQIVSKINDFRTKPFIDKIKMVNVDIKKFFNTFSNYEYNPNLPILLIDENLNNLAKEKINEIIEKKAIIHDYSSVEPYIFRGESVYVVAFQNYMNIKDVVNIFLNRILRGALYKDDSESVFVNFPYQYIGLAIGSAYFEFEGIKYNIYILVVECGIEKLQYSNIFLGRLNCKSSFVKVYDEDKNLIYKFKTNLDGSFFEYLPTTEDKLILQCGDKLKSIKFIPKKACLINFN